MLPRSILALTVASSFVALASATNDGQMNPYFACSNNTYDVILNPSDEIVIDGCPLSLTAEILEHLQQSRIPPQPIRLSRVVKTDYDTLHYLVNVTDLEYSFSNLDAIDVRTMRRLRSLNLTNNNFRSMVASAIRLPRNLILATLDMSHNRLGSLRNGTFPATQRLYLRSNNLMELDSHIVLPKPLVELDLTRNEIGDLSAVTFWSATLKVLNLSINLINAISNTTFTGLPALQTLRLECNKIFDVEPNTFDGNRNLSELNLRDNNLSTLKKGVLENLINLQMLDVSKNRLLSLTPDNVQNLNNLVHFSLSENTKLCRGGQQCKRDLQFLLMLGGRLKVLKMSRLRLRYFPVTLTTSIRALDLSGNKLRSVQTGDLENFPFLEALDLSDNEVEAVDKDVFFRMEYLRELYLHENRLTRVPGQLPPSLLRLRLDGNRIAGIGSMDFHNLSKLSTLMLNVNAIESVESGAFSSLGELKFLDISRNPVRKLRIDAFEGANHLETFYATGLLDVHIDNATDLRYFPVSELPNLRYLNLSRSPALVKSFLSDYPLLTTIKQLEVLVLDNARLTRAPVRLGRFLPRLRLVSLLGNPMNCSDHENKAVSEWVESYNSPMRTEFPHTNATERFTVMFMSRHLTRPVRTNRIVIRSRCNFTYPFEELVISREVFWPSTLTTTTTEAASVVIAPLKKLSLRSLTTTTTTLQTITKTMFSNVVRTQLPTEVTSSAQQDERASFFDWFPSLNDSTADRAASRVADVDEGGSYLQNKHPGFIFISCFMLAVFSSVIAPPCTLIHVYRRWRQRRKSLQRLDQQPNIEISSISAFVETEIRLD